MNYKDTIKLMEASKDRFIDKNPNLTKEQCEEVKDFFNKRNNLHGLIKDWNKAINYTYSDFFNIMLPYLDKDALKKAISDFCKNTRKLNEDEQNIIRVFFSRFPEEGKKVNWADYEGYTYEDFIEIMLPYQKDYLLPQEKLKDLKEGEDYIFLGTDDWYNYYFVKTFKASYTLASNNVPPKTWSYPLPHWYGEHNWINDYPRKEMETNVRSGSFYGGAKWCISMHHTDKYWNDYTKNYDFIFALEKDKKLTKEKKVAIQVSKRGDIEQFVNYGKDDSFHSVVTSKIRKFLTNNEKFKEIYGIDD